MATPVGQWAGRVARDTLACDERLRADVNGYWRERVLLEAYREAFDMASGEYHAIIVQGGRGDPPIRGPLRDWRDARRTKHRRQEVGTFVDKRAFQILIATYMPAVEPHPLIRDVWAYPGSWPTDESGFMVGKLPTEWWLEYRHRWPSK